ncbi:MAG: ATP-binding protein [Proteobacteria bacterium]|nr:ATP-binding protein [Pseudomonadota bacterium]
MTKIRENIKLQVFSNILGTPIKLFFNAISGLTDYSARHLKEIFSSKFKINKGYSILSQRDLLHAAIEAIPCHLFWCTNKFKILGSNQSWLNRLKSSDDRLESHEVFFFTESNDDEFKREVRCFLESPNAHHQYETQIFIDGQSKRWLVCLRKIAKNKGIMVLAMDTSHAWMLEQEADANRQMVIHSARMSSLGELAGGIAHEINNPLAIIHGSTQIILKHLNQNPPDVAECFSTISSISRNTERIDKIVKGMRILCRKGEVDPMALEHVNRIIDTALDLASARCASADIELRVIRHPDNPVVSCRIVQLAQVLVNLLNNALDAVRDLESRWIELAVNYDATYVVITVTDSGQGIPKPIREKMLESFYTTKPVGKGTGLGLSISKNIVDEHSGQLLYDEICPNTRFIINLPNCKENSEEYSI